MRHLEGGARAVLAAAVALGLVGFGASATWAQSIPDPAKVSVDVGKTVTTLKPGAFGAVNWFPQPYSGGRNVGRLLREAGVGSIVWDNGPGVDLYDWRTNTLKHDPQWYDPLHGGGNGIGYQGSWEEQTKPAYTFERFIQIARESGAEPWTFVNYGTGTPEEAAAWVRDAKAKNLGIKYWEIGQNLWFNGGSTVVGFSPDGHADRSAQGFANETLKFIKAMKEADPSIKVGITLVPHRPFWVLPIPGWSDEPLASLESVLADQIDTVLPSWTEQVLSILAPHLDFVDGQHYPRDLTNRTRGTMSNADLLAYPPTQNAYWDQTRALIKKYTDREVEIFVGETNSSADPGETQVGILNALFLPDEFLTFFEHGVSRVSWFAFHIGLIKSSNDGYGDFGVLSSGVCDPETGYCQPPPDYKFPAFFGMQMLSRLTDAGSHLLETKTSDALLKVHAAVRPDKRLAVMIINDDPLYPRDVTLDLAGVTVQPALTIETYGAGMEHPESEHAETHSNSVTTTIAPYTIQVLTFDTEPAKGQPSPESNLLPSSRRCVSRRKFSIRLRAPRGETLVSGSVFVNGRRVAVRKGSRLTAVVDLKGLPKGRFVVRIIAKTQSGKTLTGKRRYRTCRPKRRGQRRRGL